MGIQRRTWPPMAWWGGHLIGTGAIPLADAVSRFTNSLEMKHLWKAPIVLGTVISWLLFLLSRGQIIPYMLHLLSRSHGP